MTAPSRRFPSPVVDAAGRLAIDTPCAGCGYNLRTLPSDGICPECTHPVEHSLRSFGLRYADPAWVRGLARGLLWILIAAGGAIIARPVIGAAVYVPWLIANPASAISPSKDLLLVIELVQFVVDGLLTAVAITGLFWLTRRDPVFADRPEGLSARWLTRASCLLLPIPVVANFLMVLAMPPLPRITPDGPPPPPSAFITPALMSFIHVAVLVGIGISVLYVITPLALLRHLGGLLRRLPRPGLVRFARIEFWGLLASAAVLTAGSLILLSTMGPMMAAVLAALPAVPATAPTIAPAGAVVATAPFVPAEPGGHPVGSHREELTGGPAPEGTPTSAPAALPATWAAPPPSIRLSPAVLAGVILGGLGAVVGGLAGLAFGIAGVVLLAMSCSSLYAAAREAAQHASAPGPANAVSGPTFPAGQS